MQKPILPELAQQYQKNLIGMLVLLRHLPEGKEKQHAIMFLDTSTLWVERAFNAAQAKAEAQE